MCRLLYATRCDQSVMPFEVNDLEHVCDLEELNHIAKIADGCRTFSIAANKHVGGGTSTAELFAALYFGGVTNLRQLRPHQDGIDRVVLSKGHAPSSYYFCLWLLGNFGDVTIEQLLDFGSNTSPISRMPKRNLEWGIDMSSGSLGQGLSFANGLALGARRRKSEAWHYVILGDAECSEGQIWEAADTTIRIGLKNLTILLDVNGFGSGVIMPREDWSQRWSAFGFHCIRVNGHDIQEIIRSLHEAKANSPTVVILDTVKGYGLSNVLAGTRSVHNKIDRVIADQFRERIYKVSRDAIYAARQLCCFTETRAISRTTSLSQDTIQLQQSSARQVGEVRQTKKFAGSLDINHLMSLRVVFVLPDTASNSGLKVVLDQFGSCSWANPDSPIIECWIAEQDAASFAAGIAASGDRPVLALMEGFVWRMLDSIRQSIAYQGLPVIIFGTSGGLGDELGPMVQSDGCYMAVQSIPEIDCWEVCDENDAIAVFGHVLRSVDRPTYIRFPHERIEVRSSRIDLDKAVIETGLRVLVDMKSPDILVLTAGSLVPRVLSACRHIADRYETMVKVVEVMSPTTASRLTQDELSVIIPRHLPALCVYNGPPVVLKQFLGRDVDVLSPHGFGAYGANIELIYDAYGLTQPSIVEHIKRLLAIR